MRERNTKMNPLQLPKDIQEIITDRQLSFSDKARDSDAKGGFIASRRIYFIRCHNCISTW